ncbi:MAG: M23 family metallopeptidase [Bacillota bacterium]
MYPVRGTRSISIISVVAAVLIVILTLTGLSGCGGIYPREQRDEEQRPGGYGDIALEQENTLPETEGAGEKEFEIKETAGYTGGEDSQKSSPEEGAVQIHGANGPSPGAIPTLAISNREISPGDYFTVFLEGALQGDGISVDTKLVDGKPLFFPFAQGMVALVGVNYCTAPGSYAFNVELRRGGTPLLVREEVITVIPKEFTKQHLRVTAGQQAQRSDDLWQQDREHTRRARSQTAGVPLWEGEFMMPVQGRITTEFGVIRYINDVESGRHSGLDIAAPTGTPVRAANTGVVTLAMHLYVTGNTVIIDHGLNLFSAYSHMDRLLVTEGETVEKGTIIGEVGSTGFSTGPHLHWTISIGPVFVNPWLFFEAGV